MISRRQILTAGAAAALVQPFGGFAAPARAQAGQPLFRFGLIADPQYAPVPPRRTRFYAHSLWKVAEAVEAMNGENLAFVATLGDIIDRHYESYGHILPVYDRLRHSHFFVLGNHDYEVAADWLHAVHRTAGLRRAWYDFEGGGWRFIVLDGNDLSLFANPAGSPKRALAEQRLAALREAGAPNAQTWNGGLSEDQTSWLFRTMDAAEAAGQKMVLLCHYPVFPANEHNLWGWEELAGRIARYRHFVAFFNGHNHMGNYGEIGGKHFLNLKGMVETPDKTAFSTIAVFEDRLELTGHGLEESRTLRIA
jgi:predicted phosphodiesterase